MVSHMIYIRFMIFMIAKMNGVTTDQSVDRVKSNWWKTQQVAWRVYPIVAVINFTIMPLRYRVFFNNI